MTRYGGYLRDISTEFEQPRNTIVTEIMQMQINDVEKLARTGEVRSNGIATEREDFLMLLGH